MYIASKLKQLKMELQGKKNRGGSRKGAGRKKGSGFSGIVKKQVDDFMWKLLENDEVKVKIEKDLLQMSLTRGWIYLIKDLDNGHIKIGVTQKSNPNSRLSQYVSHKINIELLYIDSIDDCFDIEDEIHNSIEKNRVKGDWFSLEQSDVFTIMNFINRSKYKKHYNGRW